jgi:hypothetical protein
LAEQDENIVQAMRKLHSPTRGSYEASDEFNARLAVSHQLQKDIEESNKAERNRRYTKLNVNSTELLYVTVNLTGHTKT